MIDFDKLIQKGDSFVGTESNMLSYRDWLIKSAECVHCGAKYRHRPQCYGLSGGKWWLTETDCGCTRPEWLPQSPKT